MNRILLLTLLMAISFTSMAQGVTEKTMIKPVKMKGMQTLEVLLSGKVQVDKWEKHHAMIEIHVEVEGVNSQILKSLVSVGRYDLKIDELSDRILVSSKDLRKPLNVRGKMVKDVVSYTIYVPTDVSVIEQKEDVTGL